MRSLYIKLVFVFALIAGQMFGSIWMQSLNGNWKEVCRQLINGNDGSDFTFNGLPFKANFQINFYNQNVDFFDGENVIHGSFDLVADTLIIDKKIPHAVVIDKLRFVIGKQSEDSLILFEYNPKLDNTYYVKKFIFQRDNVPFHPTLSSNQILDIADKMPVFNNGKGGLDKFIKKNCNYPKELYSTGLSGLVVVKLTINEKGEIIEDDILANPKLEFAIEAIRLVRKMPKWKPAQQNEKNVMVNYYISINFSSKSK